MSNDLLETLPLPQRLALSYVPREARAGTLGLLALDQRLASILRAGGEPIIAQVKLAWWRERLAEPTDSWPAGEPLLALLREWPGNVAALGALVDGWEQLLADEFDEETALAFAAGRSAGWEAMARALDCRPCTGMSQAATLWALVDLAFNLGTKEERNRIMALAAKHCDGRRRLARPLRALAVLSGLSRRALQKRKGGLLSDPAAGFLALRLGMTGR